MIGSIYIAMSGLHGYENGLRVIANNTANLNTPGFKGGMLQFADMFYAGAPAGGGSGQYGLGLRTLGTLLDFKQGELQNTGNPLDLAVDGQGMFLLRDASGRLHLTRDGQFQFNANKVLVSASTSEEVLAFDASGGLAPITLSDYQLNAAQATRTIAFSGNLSSQATTFTAGNVTVIDGAGASHALSVRFDAVAGSPGTWNVTVLDGATTVGTGQLVFGSNGRPDAAHSQLSFAYTPAGGAQVPLTLDFSQNVTSANTDGSLSTLKMASQDGFTTGTLQSYQFDATGTLVLTYSNGQKSKGRQLALGFFSSPEAVRPTGDNEFEATGTVAWQIGRPQAGELGSIQANTVERSNVDLSQEFSNLVIMQRGYQASSQVISTASEMLNDLFGMKK